MLTTATAAPITDRTDFARQLHAQLSELRLKICNAPADSGELADRLRAQAAQATSLDFGPLAEALSACEAILRGADVLGRIDDADLEQLSEAFDQISALLNAETERERTPTSGPMPLVGTAAAHGSRTASAAMPVNVLLVGPVALVGTLQEGSRTPFRIERVESVAAAKTLAPTLPPDVVVLDTDTDGAMDLVQSLADDALTDAIPIIALGRWRSPAAAAPYLALGVARCLSKPVAAEALRQTCAEVTVLHAGNSFEPVGKTSVDGLGSRLADELQRALCDAAEPDVRGRAFDFGDGADVLTTLWDAVGRIRELVTAKSEGQIRFHVSGAEQALPNALWLESDGRRSQSDRTVRLGEVRGRTPERTLDGCDVVIAEDDLSMNWFLAGLLRDAGGTVHDAFDGHQALTHAFKVAPSVVISDVVMPGIDGFSLCRSLKRDVLLRGVPVILLSWKEDLLQRARDLGADAAGYICKDATGETIVQRVLEVLRPQRQVTKRIKAGGRVRGRLDGLTPYTLLKLVISLRPNARVTVREAMGLFEIDVRDGKPVRATRTNIAGERSEGIGVLQALLGIGAGRFGVEDASAFGESTPNLSGDLDELLRPRIALARGAQGLVAGHRMVEVEQVGFADALMTTLLQATPEPSRGILRALITGTSPRELVMTGRASAAMVEAVLCDAARQGGITAVVGANNTDELPEAVARELAVLGGSADAEAVRESLAAFAVSVSNFDSRAEQSAQRVSSNPNNSWLAERATTDREDEGDAGAVDRTDEGEADAVSSARNDDGRFTIPLASDDVELVSGSDDDHVSLPAVTDDAALLEGDDSGRPTLPAVADDEVLADRFVTSPESEEPLDESPSDPSVVSIEVLVNESAAPPAGEQRSGPLDESPSLSRTSIEVLFDESAAPPVAQRGSNIPEEEPATDTGSSARKSEARASANTPILASAVSIASRAPSLTPMLASAMETDGEGAFAQLDTPRKETKSDQDHHDDAKADDGARSQPPATSAEAGAAPFSREVAREADEHPRVPRLPMPSSYASHDPRRPRAEKKSMGRYGWPLLFGVLGLSIAIGARWWREQTPTTALPAPPPSTPAAPLPIEPGVNPQEQPADPAHAPSEPLVELPISNEDKAKLQPGEGLLEVVAGRNDKIHIDGRMVGNGPVVKLPVRAGEQHEVRVKLRGEERVRYATVKEGVRVRLRVAPPWSR